MRDAPPGLVRLAELVDGVDVGPFLIGDRLDLNRFLAANHNVAATDRLRFFGES